MNLVCCPPYIHHTSTSRGDWLNRWIMAYADIPLSADPDAEHRLNLSKRFQAREISRRGALLPLRLSHRFCKLPISISTERKEKHGPSNECR